jgi:photosystem II stability/assembly factor-like uncharacterized protein
VFADPTHGWAAGRGGILGTRDGRSWRVQTGMPIRALTAVDATDAWALARSSLLRTRDGIRWQVATRQAFAAVSFADAETGFALRPDGTLRRTSDGGVTWRSARGPTRRVQALCFSGATVGYVAAAGIVWRTIDGGRTWRASRLRPSSQGFPVPQLGCRGRDAWAVFHEGAGAGTEAYFVFRSLDRGAHWREVLASPFQRRLPPISNYSGPFSVLGAGAAVFVGSCGPCGRYQPTATVVRTTDGGLTFTRRTPFDGYAPESVSFVDANRGWLLTSDRRRSDGVVWSTVDGGTTWHRVLTSGRLVE